MSTPIPDITALPLELFRIVLSHAVHVRGLKRAMRLRLVNREMTKSFQCTHSNYREGLFSNEVMQLMIKSRYLENCEVSITRLGNVGAEFMIHRLLFTQLPVGTCWNGIRRISRSFAEDEDNSEQTYQNYVKLLCRKAANFGASMKKTCDPAVRKRGYTKPFDFEYDMITASVYANKLHFIDDLGNRKCNTDHKTGTFGSLFGAAIQENNHAVVDLLLAKRKKAGGDIPEKQYLAFAIESGDIAMTKKFLPQCTQDSFEAEKILSLREPHETMCTPNVELFEMLRTLKKRTPDPEMDQRCLAELLTRVCASGWDDIAKHLLSLGAPVNSSDDSWHYSGQPPLTAACMNGHTELARLLLRHDAEISPNVYGDAAERRHWHIVWMLIDEYWVDDSKIEASPVIYAAIDQERTDMLHEFLKRGASLEGHYGERAAARARQAGLDSMLDFLEEHGVDVSSNPIK
jgi:hypothetical protein